MSCLRSSGTSVSYHFAQAEYMTHVYIISMLLYNIYVYTCISVQSAYYIYIHISSSSSSYYYYLKYYHYILLLLYTVIHNNTTIMSSVLLPLVVVQVLYSMVVFHSIAFSCILMYLAACILMYLAAYAIPSPTCNHDYWVINRAEELSHSTNDNLNALLSIIL